ncbi:DUF6434 domain-containing protein [Jannaschia sp. CCS1]|uniref:DUF6434 domain-containing protein n=1 Tax=Jannaschia sp. (strain CCS1) TaxID=290400 RepID=UPI000053C3D4|nr:DUF6434 domain-containing protein [Jannaschia sp. CCS1]ABD53605.1 hypothetical protein Jann_0688 [Jannaschia sp. CCS1]
MPRQMRPDIADIRTGADLRQWYWRKDELVAHARTLGLKRSGAKFTILDRIAHFLDTGARDLPEAPAPKPTSDFDWHSAKLTPDTILTDSYKNTQNVRRFFKAQLGPRFAFSIPLMAWLKENSGKTLSDACAVWRDLQAERRRPGWQSDIKGHNQFNQYTRDFLAAHPDLGMDDVRRVWARKIQQPSPDGRHIYEPSDLDL